MRVYLTQLFTKVIQHLGVLELKGAARNIYWLTNVMSDVVYMLIVGRLRLHIWKFINMRSKYDIRISVFH